MFWVKRKIKIKITFEEEKGEIEVKCSPKYLRPSKIIQILWLAIETVNKALQKELKPEEEKKQLVSYVS